MTRGPAIPDIGVDPFDEKVIVDPYPFHEALREVGPVGHLPRHQLYAIGRHADVHAAFTNWQGLVSGRGVGLDDFESVAPLRRPSLLLETDPPAHTAYRQVMSSVVNPATVRKLREGFEAKAEALVDELVERGSFDAVEELAERFPLAVFPQAVGIRDGGDAELLAYGSSVFNILGPRNDLYDESVAALPRVASWIEVSCSRELLSPDGFGARIWEAADRGEVSLADAPLLTRSLLSAGIDTTVFALGNLMHAIARHPAQWSTLLAEPRRTRLVFEEALRWDSTIQSFFRTTGADVTVGDMTIPEGSKVLLSLGAANRDPRKWGPDAAEFDIRRSPGGHVAFGMGIHQCVGQPIARLEAEVLLDALVKRVRAIELDGEPVPKPNNVLRGWASLPVRLVAA